VSHVEPWTAGAPAPAFPYRASPKRHSHCITPEQRALQGNLTTMSRGPWTAGAPAPAFPRRVSRKATTLPPVLGLNSATRRASRGTSNRANHGRNPPATQTARGPARGLPRPLGRDSSNRTSTQLPSRRRTRAANPGPKGTGFHGQIHAGNRVQSGLPNRPLNRSGNGSPCDSRRVDSNDLDRA
jgi:hypothetical protein